MTRGGGLADQQGSAAQGRLVRQASRYRTFRLGLRIRQRVLSRYRRYRHGAAGAACTPKASNPQAQAAAERRAINWLLAMQSEDGGWAAFDVDNNWAVLNEVPFADHNAMLDPTCPDITGRVLECLCRRGMAGHESVRRGVRYLLQGAGEGRKLVRPLGRELHLRIVPGDARSGGEPVARERWTRLPRRRAGCARIQNPDGGWGESCASYERDHFVSAPSCPSQTAWAVAGPAGGRRSRLQPGAARHPSFCWTGSVPMERGRKMPPPARVFPMSSTSLTACTATTFRCWRLAALLGHVAH